MRDWDVAAIVRADYDQDGHPQAQPDAYGEDDAGLKPHALYGFGGFFSMPHECVKGKNGVPDPTRAAPSLTGWYNEHGYVFPLTDPRLITKLPSCLNGGSVQFGGKLGQPSFSWIDESGSFQIYVPYAFQGEGEKATPTKSMSIAVNVRTPGAETIEIVHGSGLSLTAANGSWVLKNAKGDAYVEVNDAGVVINGTTIIGSPGGSGALVLAAPLIEIFDILKLAIIAGAGAAAPAAKQALRPLEDKIDAMVTKLVTGA